MKLIELKKLKKNEFDEYLKTFDIKNCKSTKRVRVIISKIFEFRSDLKEISKIRENIKFIYYAYINDIYDMNLVFGDWDYDKRLIKEPIYKETEISKKIFYTSTYYKNSTLITYKSPFLRYFFKHGIDIYIEHLLDLSREELADKLFPIGTCKNCKKILLRSENHSRGRKTCSKECESILSSRRMKDDNPLSKLTDSELKIKYKKQSKSMKEKIKRGEFTPCVTNSWSRSRVVINGIPTRSSWDALFLLYNPSLDYEAVRIEYKIDEDIHNYIVDFEDKKERILYEIKPSSEKNTLINQLKFKAAKNWCINNDYKFIIISDDWFIERLEVLEQLAYYTKLDDESRRKINNSIGNFYKIRRKNGNS